MSVSGDIELEESGGADLPEQMRTQGSDYGGNVARNLELLDVICREVGCKPLGDFALVTWKLVDDEPRDGPWYDPGEGLAAVVNLERVLANDTLDARLRAKKVERSNILWDLRAYRLILEAAVGRGERFRIAVY